MSRDRDARPAKRDGIVRVSLRMMSRFVVAHVAVLVLLELIYLVTGGLDPELVPLAAPIVVPLLDVVPPFAVAILGFLWVLRLTRPHPWAACVGVVAVAGLVSWRVSVGFDEPISSLASDPWMLSYICVGLWVAVAPERFGVHDAGSNDAPQ